MRTPYNLNVQQNCSGCELRKSGWFCDSSTSTLEALEASKFTAVYPKGSTLVVEGEQPRGVFVVCSGRVKLSTSSSEGRTLIVDTIEPGGLIGVGAVVLGKPYEITAETAEPAQVNFIARDAFLRLISTHADAGLRAAQQLSESVLRAHRDIRSLGLSQTTSEKLARLILNWCDNGEQTPRGVRLQVLLTHEEIAQTIGTTRETVTRILSDLKRKHIIDVKGSNFFVPNMEGLMQMVTV
jgi:CRP/FNR family cyclic AMP-dependent transcriptional regulator